jgi:hypothetical protein
MKIPGTINVICEAWTAAENELVNEVRKYNPGIGEEGTRTNCFVKTAIVLTI